MHAARVNALTPPGEPQRYSITALEDRMGDLLTAADALETMKCACKDIAEDRGGLIAELERETAARKQAQVDREAAIAARDRAGVEDSRKWREQLRAAARDEMANWPEGGANSWPATTAIKSLCKRLGVTL
jgi:hypothetical protein